MGFRLDFRSSLVWFLFAFDLSKAKTLNFDGSAFFFFGFWFKFWCDCHLASFGWLDPGFRPALKGIVPRTQLRARGEKNCYCVTNLTLPVWASKFMKSHEITLVHRICMSQEGYIAGHGMFYSWTSFLLFFSVSLRAVTQVRSSEILPQQDDALRCHCRTRGALQSWWRTMEKPWPSLQKSPRIRGYLRNAKNLKYPLVN